MTASAFPLRRGIVLADLIPGALSRDVVLVAGGAGLTGLAAQIAVPVPGTPVPVTGQTFAVLLVGAALGPVRALSAMLLYLMAGAAGVPWFAHHGSGAGAADFGYIVGFVVAAAVVGELARRGGDRTPVRVIGTMIIGNLLVYAVGLPWLALAVHVDLGGAFRLGMWPFLAGDALKMVVAAGLLPGAWALTRWLGVKR